jgi:hypothetical protein
MAPLEDKTELTCTRGKKKREKTKQQHSKKAREKANVWRRTSAVIHLGRVKKAHERRTTFAYGTSATQGAQHSALTESGKANCKCKRAKIQQKLPRTSL